MMHPFATVVGLFDEDLHSTHGPWGQHLHSLEFYESDASRGFVRGAKWGLQPTGGPVSMTRAYPWGDNAIWGAGFHEGIRKRLGHSAMWGIIAEDLPDEDNRVVLDPNRTDSDGIPAPKIIYRTSEQTRRLLDFHCARATESLEAAGAHETVVAPQIRETGWHLLGTAKMGHDPSTSVVDPWGRSARYPEPIHIRRQHLADFKRHEPHGHDRRHGAPLQRAPCRAASHGRNTHMNLMQAQRTLLASLADVLVPASGGMPSASEAGVAGQGLDAVLMARPDLLGGLKELLREVDGQAPIAAVASLRSAKPALFDLLGEIVAGAYFMNPHVRQAIGYHGQMPQAIDPQPDYLEDGLLDSVIRRGPIYRPTPAD